MYLFNDNSDPLFFFLAARLTIRKTNIATTVTDSIMLTAASAMGRTFSLKVVVVPSTGGTGSLVDDGCTFEAVRFLPGNLSDAMI